jgi:hypothetical protein
MFSKNDAIRFDIQPLEQGWRWTTFDLFGAPLNAGAAGSKREAAAFVIREIMRASQATERLAHPLQLEAA